VDEREWLSSTDPQAMLDFLRDSGIFSGRKARLFAAACCRRIWHLLHDARSRRAVEVAEWVADGLAGEQDRESAEEAALEASHDAEEDAPGGGKYMSVELTAAPDAAADAVGTNPVKAAATARFAVLCAAGHLWGEPITDELHALDVSESEAQAALLRDLFKPHRRIALDPRWLTPEVVGLAQAIYDERAFERLPLLAEALANAGCTNADVLGHCRRGGVHVKGCCPLDLLLGKK
jgi:hypothetical protein